MQRRELRHKKLQQLLEVEGARAKKGVKGIEGESKEGRKSGEVHDVTSESSMDENRFREDRYP